MQKSAARRQVLAGYPSDIFFETPEQLADYFSGDRIICLECGKAFRTLGNHLMRIHKTTVEEYQRMHGIPWTYGLSCAETTALHAEQAKENYKTGLWVTSVDQAKMARLNLIKQRPRQPVREVLVARNIEKMNEGCTGEDAKRRASAAKRGTPEFYKKMINRPQCSPDHPNREMLKTWWKGKKQSPEHIRKRTESRQANGWNSES